VSIYQTENGKWRVQVGSGKTRKTKVFTTKREAERWNVEQEQAREGISPITWSDLADDYFHSSKFFEKADKTQPVEIKASKPVLAHFGPVLVATTTADDIDAYKELRLFTVSPRTGRKLSGNTVRLELAFLSSLITIALRKHIITNNPMTLVEMPKCNERDVRINDSELAIIFETLSAMAGLEEHVHFTYFNLLFAIGCRPSELAELKYDDVSLKNRQIRFRRTKNTKSRTVPVAGSDFHLLIKWLRREDRPDMQECPYVFPCVKRKGGWSSYDFSNAWKTIKRKVGKLISPGISPHAFRHERISRWFEQTNMNEGQIMELSGHLTAAALNRYRHIRAENFRGQIEILRNKDEANMIDAFGHVYKNGKPLERPSFDDELKKFWNDAEDELLEK
jgi:integrase